MNFQRQGVLSIPPTNLAISPIPHTPTHQLPISPKPQPLGQVHIARERTVVWGQKTRILVPTTLLGFLDKSKFSEPQFLHVHGEGDGQNDFWSLQSDFRFA